MKKMSHRLLMIPFFTVLVILALSLTARWGMNKQRDVLETIHKADFGLFKTGREVAGSMAGINASGFKLINRMYAGAKGGELETQIKEYDAGYESVASQIKQCRSLWEGTAAERQENMANEAGSNPDVEKPGSVTGFGALLDELEKDIVSYRKVVTEAMKIARESDVDIGAMMMLGAEEQYKKTELDLQRMLAIAQERSDTNFETAHADHKRVERFFICIAALFLVASLVGFWLIGRSIKLPILRAVDALNVNAAEIARSSSMLTTASSTSTEGANRQAASVDKTCVGLSGIAAIIKKNSESAGLVDQIMVQANSVIERANTSMEDLNVSMAEIFDAGTETTRIVKTIDEIAFQTNLLALNSAVEAARGGEAGAGFAVVAEEVRSLAKRAADAARNTTQIIEGTVRKVEKGSNLVRITSETFRDVTSSTDKVNQIVIEIAAATREQSVGIEAINQSIGEISDIAQENAVTADGLASASQSLGKQADTLKDVILGLVTMVKGNEDTEKQRQRAVQ